MLVALIDDEPQVLTLQEGALLPSGPFEGDHPTLQTGLRAWVERQTHHPLGYVEQLYTFADRNRAAAGSGRRIVSISYLGLTRERAAAGTARAGLAELVSLLPLGGLARRPAQAVWRRRSCRGSGVDRRGARPRRQARAAPAGRGAISTSEAWNEELVLQRYELLYEAAWCRKRGGRASPSPIPCPGEPMRYDHRRILATGIARLRAKIKYRPVVFELMPPTSPWGSCSAPSRRWPGAACTSRTSAAWSSSRAWSRRPAPLTAETGGRPAKLYRFRREILLERAVAGTKLPLARSASRDRKPHRSGPRISKAAGCHPSTPRPLR